MNIKWGKTDTFGVVHTGHHISEELRKFKCCGHLFCQACRKTYF